MHLHSDELLSKIYNINFSANDIKKTREHLTVSNIPTTQIMEVLQMEKQTKISSIDSSSNLINTSSKHSWTRAGV